MNHSATSARARGRRVPVAVIAAATATLLLSGCAGQDTADSQTSPGQSAGLATGNGTTADGQAPATGSGAGQAVAALDRSVPQRVVIPSLGVSSKLETLGQNAEGAMTTPKDPDLAGWYEPGTTPGSQGPAVIAGHVTFNGADAVFKKLKTIEVGAVVEVEREDGKIASFTVDRVEEYEKKAFPTLEVYKNVDHAGLRLVTCGGEFDADRHYYPNNVVVFATMTGVV